MTREEAWNSILYLIDAIIARHEIDDDYVTITSFLDYDALRMARKALEQEPSGDLISRQELLEDLYKRDYTKFTHRDFVALVQYQDTVQQEPKTGHWIEKDNNLYVCSECGQYIYSETEHDLLEFHAFCGRCGARMVEPQESEE